MRLGVRVGIPIRVRFLNPIMKHGVRLRYLVEGPLRKGAIAANAYNAEGKGKGSAGEGRDHEAPGALGQSQGQGEDAGEGRHPKSPFRECYSCRECLP